MAYDKDAWRRQVKNGMIAPSMLAEIEPRQFDIDLNGPAVMHPEAAAAMSALLKQAKADGITSLYVKYSYRTIAKQWEKWENYQNGGNLAAYPGTSNHGWAVAVDFSGLTTAALAWVKQNAKKYCFLNDVPSENWHYTYQGGYTPEPEDDVTGDDLLKGIKAFTQGDPEPAEGPAAAVWRALTKAASQPKPADHEHAGLAKKAHEHEVKGKAV